MRLATLLREFFPISPTLDREISGLYLDSRLIIPHSVFIALHGTKIDGRQFIRDAISKGADAILIDQNNSEVQFEQQVPILPIPNLKQKIGELAAQFYAYPARKLRIIGVTGTSGKTSCTHFLAQTLQNLEGTCGLIGTLGNGFVTHLQNPGLTTPDVITLQAQMNSLVKAGAKSLAMEVSSHGIHQERIQKIPFEIGIFTNLSQDHLDYHGNMQSYAEVKYQFLQQSLTKKVILNADDSYGKEWFNQLKAHKPVFAYTLNPKAHQLDSNWIYTSAITKTSLGMDAQINSPWGVGKLSLSLLGDFNLSNALAVLSALCLYGIPFERALTALSQLKAVPGRMQILSMQHLPIVVVDYAHKPDALEKVLKTLRAHTKGKLICVFGCGGERDTLKRPLMAQIAERLADRVIVTNDNPRHENPNKIIEDILSGFEYPKRVLIEADRSKAIENSIQWATPQDCILIAGKGAERYQQIGDEKIPFDDVEKVNLFFKRGKINQC